MTTKSGSGRTTLLLAGGVMAGIGIGWLTAPRRGRWVRNQARQRLQGWRRRAGRDWHKSRKDAANRWHGAWAIARETFGRGRMESTTPDARTLVDRVHSQLGRRFAATLRHANLSAVGDVIFVHGFIPTPAERDELVEAIAAVHGVGGVRAGAVRTARPGRGQVTEFPPARPRRQVR